MLKYKGYTGHVEFDDETDIFHGEVLDTRDVITFQGGTVEELRRAFRDSIDDYLEFCAERNEKPEGFYLKYGFIPFKENKLTLAIPIKTIIQSI